MISVDEIFMILAFLFSNSIYGPDFNYEFTAQKIVPARFVNLGDLIHLKFRSSNWPAVTEQKVPSADFEARSELTELRKTPSNFKTFHSAKRPLASTLYDTGHKATKQSTANYLMKWSYGKKA
jgi:hypothetical protein